MFETKSITEKYVNAPMSVPWWPEALSMHKVCKLPRYFSSDRSKLKNHHKPADDDDAKTSACCVFFFCCC